MRVVGSWAILSLALSALACGGSSEGDGPGAGAGGSLNIGSGGTGSGNLPNNVTGGEPLSPERLNELRNSACTGWKAEAEPGPAIMQLVVDVSGSMRAPAPGTNRSKWAVTRDALIGAITDLPASTGLGMLLYPNMRTSASTVERPVTSCVNTDAMIPLDLLGEEGSQHRQELVSGLPRDIVSAGTPTHDAYDHALGAFAARSFAGNRFMMLITDGQPTFLKGCLGTGRTEDPVDEEPIITAIGAAKAQGIRTFVLGSPGSERNESTGDDARPWLSRAASAGGTEAANCSHTGPNYCHFDMTQEADFSAALERTLAQIAGQIISCNFSLPMPPAGQTLDPLQTNVVYLKGGQDTDAQLIFKNGNADCDRGWKLGADRQSIELCGATCDAIQTDPGARLELMFGCDTPIVPVR